MGIEIDKETAQTKELRHGHTTVGAEPVKLTNNFKFDKGVLVRCPGSSDPDGANDFPVWIGGPGVTADRTATGGIPIMPGSTMILPVDDPSKLWVVSLGDGQDIAWMGV